MNDTTATTTTEKPVTVPRLRAAKGKTKIAMVTAYDATFAQILDEAGVDVLLVGDSLGMVVQGNETTLGVTLDEMIYHCKAVARGAKRAHIVADMPFLSYQVTAERALDGAGRLLAEGRAHAVKVEGGRAIAKTITRLVQTGIPVMGHVGLTPQSVHAMGGFRVQGRENDAERVFADACAVAEAGAYAIVLEGIPGPLAAKISQAVAIPTIGIGAGSSCDGQVLVCYDLFGLTANLRPKFVKRYTEWFEAGREAAAAYVADVREGRFPADEHTFGS